MSRERRRPVAQATWRAGQMHVWGWDGESSASSAWLFGGFGQNRWTGAANGWHDTPASYGEVARLDLDLPHRRVLTSCIRLAGAGAAAWLSELPGREHVSPSIRWSAGLTGFAVALVSAGRVTPVLVDEAGVTAARWRPVHDDSSRRHLAALDRCAPPVCRIGSTATAADLLDVVVDDLVRSMLQRSGWRPELGRRRTAHVQALRAVFVALARRDALVRSGSDEFDAALGLVRTSLDRHLRRREGEPVVRPRLRLAIPRDAHDPWVVALELVDELDAARWCTADDVWSASPRAVDLAGGSEHLDRLATAV
ncbi:MAG: hypothetical protein MUE78_07050, partial [Ilumatobacteraceae bacterium]|nr:hypothetical protein [Ilumatobacteraceae bacterium]